ncbi:uncharacterized protein LOC129777849 isoform X1 [Toxorhynchites rutilus septentrionalis]|uniref:uncharacterized protein LOC129777849 isoform X1 n=1 Tax=Toxorhynchites rutilus septentrionalis TaxID=329112 RepID=UPI0024790F95|nr:uncharacterized protein LOC129777849 isoform X1 [Toxorhynchites rutilus septentrionalis]XP_055640369.1 uncharacterized protein LOC129777849 isoform X1 [Toxorhynchites rutilus septentrionalis]XP_055640370.1 uncharacterized protein LOC129777849 isoform X1 [Toxorhynchites rutilus septentrionalis]XP_055640371.1 uncharacterized protein LOC129777849 isoform X1 [Toxorhynchites rutilus septentrionalis]XP_055640372.1 uncharacterized protein LOC129777849 isoform X1 [Toxorhynchites rutilus septentriona
MAGQVAHLNNPTFLFELVEKLPANLKLDWALYKQRHHGSNLTTFAHYMSTMVSAASEVTLNFDSRQSSRSGKMEARNFFGAHSTNETSEDKSKEVPSYAFSESNTDVSLTRRGIPSCLVCKNPDHRVKDCNIFAKMSLDERWKAVTNYELCKSCLGMHGRRPCKQKRVCGVEGCQFKHHLLLHNKRTRVEANELKSLNPLKTKKKKKKRTRVEAQRNASQSEGVIGHHYAESATLFKIVPVVLHKNNRSITIFAFLDDGSSMTLVDREVADMLDIKGESAPLCLQWTANVTRTEPNSTRIALNISGVKGKKYKLSDVRTVNKLNLPKQLLRYGELATLYPHLRGLPVSDYEEAVPQILIGNDYSHLGAALKIHEGALQEPIAVKTRLGWTVYEVTQQQRSRQAQIFHICECVAYQALQDQMKQHFSIESLGVMAIECPQSEEDKRANDILRKTTKRIGERFETGLLWKSDDFVFPDSFAMAERRLICLERRMKRDKNIESSVRRQMREYEEKGYIHKATLQELREADSRRTWYLPLGVVLNPKKPAKIRIFCDAAAKVDGKSLNSMLLKGPDFLSSLLSILFGFRERKIAICAEIQEMYHQIKIRKEDCNAQRILWREKPSLEPVIYIMNVATFGSTCSPSSAQYVMNLNAKEHSTEYPEAAEAILMRHYVDDYLDSKDSESEAIKLAKDVKLVHSHTGFHLRNWLSNSSRFIEQIGETATMSEKRLTLLKAESIERVLGMAWRPNVDVFIFSATLAMHVEHPTKRQVLRAVMSLFDPLGLLSFFLVQGKVLVQDVQDLWRSNIEWDQLIPAKLHEKWSQWTSKFNQLNMVSIHRQYFSGYHTSELESMELHIFVDASESAYACVAYFRAKCAGRIKCALVVAKSKVAPLKCISIPRLELQAAIIGVRLQKTILASHSLPIHKRVFWSDSKTVLAWINSDHRRYRQFVACRVGEILTKSNAEDWRWVPTKENVADEATKWKADIDFSPENRWFKGPKFLHESEEKWPVNNKCQTTTNEEIKTCNFHQSKTCNPPIKWERFSKWTRLRRTVAYIVRYVENLRRKVTQSAMLNGPLLQGELTKAENHIWKWVQGEAYAEDIRRISTSESNQLYCTGR